MAWSWSVPISYEVFPRLAGIALRDFHLDPAACAESFRKSRPIIREMFGPELHIPACYCPPLTYGHLACLGARVVFPADSAPAVQPLCANIDECLEVVSREERFQENEIFRLYLGMRDHLQAVFPGENVPLGGFNRSGPITSAVLLRGQDFFSDLFDQPERTKEFLDLLTASLVRFTSFIRRVNDLPPPPLEACGISDDFASLLGPALWPEFVLPSWEGLYRALSDGPRSLHCEGLSPAHLPLLEGLGLSSYDPDCSPRLSPGIISAAVNIPFAWSLQGFDYPSLSLEDVGRWVRDAAAGGASRVYSYIYVNMCAGDTPAKVRAFMQAAAELESKARPR